MNIKIKNCVITIIGAVKQLFLLPQNGGQLPCLYASNLNKIILKK